MRAFLKVVRVVVIVVAVVVVVVFGVAYWAMDTTYGAHGKVTMDHMQMHAFSLAASENEFYGRAHTFTADLRKLGDDFRFSDDDSTKVIAADSNHWSASVGYPGRSGTCMFGGSRPSTTQGAASDPDAIVRAASCSDAKTDRLWHARRAAAR